MSLVNDMLRDLDQRRQVPDAKGLAMSPALSQSTNRSNTRWLPLLLLSLVVLTAVAGLWLYDHPQQWRSLWPASEPTAVAVPAATKTIVVQPAVSKPVATDPVVNKPVEARLAIVEQIKAEQIKAEQTVAEQTKAEKTTTVQLNQALWSGQQPPLQLLLTLNQKPARRIEVSTEQGLQLQLGPIESLVQLPPPSSALVRLAELIEDGANLTLALQTAQPVRFQVVGRDVGEQHQLTITIEPRLDPVVPQQQPTDVVEIAVAPLAVAAVATAATPVQAEPQVKPQTQPQAKSLAGQPSARTPVKPQAASVSPRVLQKTLHQTAEQKDLATLSKARVLISRGQLTQAQQLLSAFIAEHPTASNSRSLLATLKIGTQQTASALPLIEAGIAIDPTDAGLRKLKARLLLQAGQLSQAIELLSFNAMPSYSGDPEYHQIRAATLQAAGRYQQAAEAYHGLLRVRASEPAWWVGLALSLEALQQPAQARRAYLNVLQIPQLSSTLSGYVKQRLARLGG